MKRRGAELVRYLLGAALVFAAVALSNRSPSLLHRAVGCYHGRGRGSI
jgi:hypothetical protein